MKLTHPTALATFMRRTSNIFHAHKKRARKLGRQLDYDLDHIRRIAREADLCCYCGAALRPSTFSVDHRNPTSRSRDFSAANLQTCCRRCNEIKCDLTFEEFQALAFITSQWPVDVQVRLFARLRAGGKIVGGRR